MERQSDYLRLADLFQATPTVMLEGFEVRKRLIQWSAQCAALVVLAILIFFARTANAEVELAKVFTEHMVLQRHTPVHVWGWAKAREQVRARFRGETQQTAADENGRWEVFFQPGEAGGPFSLEISGTNSVHLEDILVGDVWIASGQSNMVMPLSGWGPKTEVKDSKKEIAAANHPTLRFLTVTETSSTYPLDDVETNHAWQVCTPEAAGSFSAVAYFFARDLQERVKIPIGIIVAAWGGTPIEAWTSVRALSSEPSLMPIFGVADVLNRRRSSDLRVIAEEAKEDNALRASGKEPPTRSDRRNVLSWQPGALFNGMIAPLTPLAVKGVIWYQGESNTDQDRAPFYAKALPTMISDWRREWRQSNLPFLYVQISSLALDPPSPWSVVREAQRRALQVAHTAMAVSADVGDPNNVHPPDKQTVGYRLALAAGAVAYGESIEFSGPSLRYIAPSNGRITVWFDHANGLRAIDNKVTGFEVAGIDRKFVSASAIIAGDSVVVSSPTVEHPVYVRYAWIAAPQMSLINSDGLPASPFTSEDDYDRKENLSK
ncbi:MAG: sialate O-acetylesterase [Terracidiphilus sp.]|nr:sialate O-acetylesterase [Terracidiphilus sp.]